MDEYFQVSLLQRLDAAVIAGFIFVCMTIGWLAFYRIGRHRAERRGELDLGPVGDAIGILLALFLAFNFSMSNDRFDAREQLIVDEANAIETSFLHCVLLPEPERNSCKTKLREYVGLRVKLYDSHGPEVAAGLIHRSDELQRELWQEASQVMLQKESVSGALVLMGLRELFAVHDDRVAARRLIVPGVVLVVTMALCVGWATFDGYAYGLHSAVS